MFPDETPPTRILTAPEKYIMNVGIVFFLLLMIAPSAVILAASYSSTETDSIVGWILGAFFVVLTVAGFLAKRFLDSFDKSISEQKKSQESQFKILRETDEKQYNLIAAQQEQTNKLFVNVARTEEKQKALEERCNIIHRGV